MRFPNAPEQLSQQFTAFVQRVRQADLYKVPGVAETLDWAEALWALDQKQLDPSIVGDTLGALIKYQDDVSNTQGEAIRSILAEL